MNEEEEFIVEALQEEMEYSTLYKHFHLNFPQSIAFEERLSRLIKEGKVKLWQNPVTQQHCLFRS